MILVLDALTKAPFELHNVSTLELNYLVFQNSVFPLLSFRSKVWQIHALEVSRLRWTDDYKEVFLRPYVGFMAKTHVARDPSTALIGF